MNIGFKFWKNPLITSQENVNFDFTSYWSNRFYIPFSLTLAIMDCFQSFSLNNTKTVSYFGKQIRKCQINQNPTYFLLKILQYNRNRAIFLYSEKKVFCFQETSDVQKVQFTFIWYLDHYGYKKFLVSGLYLTNLA